MVTLKPSIGLSDGGVADGYYQAFGIAARKGELGEVLTSYLDKELVWEIDTIEEVNVLSLDHDVQERIEPVIGRGIWYVSGRAFFSQSVEETT